MAVRLRMIEGRWLEAASHIESGLEEYPYSGILLGYRVFIDSAVGNLERANHYRRYLNSLQRRLRPGPDMLHIHAAAADIVYALCTGHTHDLIRTVEQLRSVAGYPGGHPFIRIRSHILLCIAASLINDPELAEEHFDKLKGFTRYHLIRPYFRFRALALAAHTMGNHGSAKKFMNDALGSVRSYQDRPMEAQILYELCTLLIDGNESGDTPRVLREHLNKVISTAADLGMEYLEKRAKDLLANLPSGEDTAPALHFHLTGREREILGLVGEGFSNSGIAEVLRVSTHTVSNHMKNILQKTGTRNRTAAFTAAKREKIL
jgi:DNA-binding CsgD family transcriptional regulator